MKQSNPQNNQETNFDDLKDNYNCKYIPCKDYRQKIKDCLNSNEMKNELENLRSKITNDNISQADTIALLRNICIKLSDNSLRKIKFANSNNSYKGKNFQEWYDEDCKQAKKEVNEYRKLYQETLRNKLSQTETKLRKQHFFKAINSFNSIKRKKERMHWKRKREALRLIKLKNRKEFWKKLKLKHKGMPFNFNEKELFDYFRNLSGSANEVESESGINKNINGEGELGNSYDSDLLEILNRSITIDEIKKVIMKMKTEKAGGLDKIIPELIKEFDDNLLGLIIIVLNNILDSGDFPEEWALGVIVILFKDGIKSDLNNYRGITLRSMLGKILVGVLNNRLWEVVEKFEFLKENQAGFRKGYRTTDHLFTLTTIINHYLVKNKKPLFACFIDFKKAFNTVDHKLFWDKLNHYGVEGNFLNNIKSMYEKVKSCVRSKSGITNFFNYNRGVRQGCLLSPLLFSLYINDLVNHLETDGTQGVELWEIRLCAMLYADDLILMAENENDLKLQMQALGSCIEKWNMEINPKKSKVMIFNDKKKKNKKPLFACFIDFKKAFNTVDHKLLWDKLNHYGVEGKFLNIIKSMYEKVKSCVRSKSGITNFFNYNRGVRQGCLLSPLLFSLYINDLVNHLETDGTQGVELWEIRLCAILYVDDLILMAENENDLKLQMQALGSCIEKWNMEINPKKLKVMIFND